MRGPNSIELQTGGSRRLAMRFRPDVVGALLPDSVVGAYLLYDHEEPVYIGRSDTCLRHRLMTHPLLGVASHVAWEPTSTAERAYYLEAFWYHELAESPHRLNRSHPARPGGVPRPCPYCHNEKGELGALSRALKSSAVRCDG